jgi:hypothetical protein
MNVVAINAQAEMGNTARCVHRLRLGLSDPEYRWEGLQVLEESLRLMSLPGENAGRVYYFRRTKLSALVRRTGSVVYAYKVERRCRAMAEHALHFSAPGAGHADVVYARSPVEPWIALAQHFLDPQPLNWFWPLALPQAQSIIASRKPLYVLLELMERSGVQASLEFMALSSASVLRAIFDELQPEHVAQGFSPSPRSATATGAPAEVAPLPPLPLLILPERWLATANDYVRRWSAADPRSQWLMGILLLLAAPERTLDPQLAKHAAAMAYMIEDSTKTPRASTQLKAVAGGSAQIDASVEDLVETKHDDEPSESANESSYDAGIATYNAGFFYCLGILDRMGIAATLAAHPELIDCSFVAFLLNQLARAAEIHADDAVMQVGSWFSGDQALSGERCIEFFPTMLPVQWRSRRGAYTWTLDRLARAWILALRRWLHRTTGMSLPALVSRPGHIRATRTHLEVVMPQSAIDMRIRKAAIDVNPGWLPWLGKVVSFEYVCEVLDIVPPNSTRPARNIPYRARRGGA